MSLYFRWIYQLSLKSACLFSYRFNNSLCAIFVLSFGTSDIFWLGHSPPKKHKLSKFPFGAFNIFNFNLSFNLRLGKPRKAFEVKITFGQFQNAVVDVFDWLRYIARAQYCVWLLLRREVWFLNSLSESD